MDESDWGLIIVALISLAGVGLSGLIARRTAKASARKDDGDAAQSVTDTALKLIRPLEDRIDQLEALAKQQAETILRLQAELGAALKLSAEYLEGIDRLIHQVKSRGDVPVYVPAKVGAEPQAGTGPLLGGAVKS